ncbi:hypothetical protein AQ914_04505 [Burkholderia pseudomallei]|uniref:SpaN/EivJ family type III secretion system needle length determinant n=1 Tax=Burkholderia pseudomallei TaxID=28450 RepID=UPI00097812E8|nr:hypothetical protein [Burkholderia pseudomallei]ONC26347.1 hypothetical protein AQ914_04505 [Burkholderia pseudomallei]
MTAYQSAFDALPDPDNTANQSSEANEGMAADEGSIVDRDDDVSQSEVTDDDTCNVDDLESDVADRNSGVDQNGIGDEIGGVAARHDRRQSRNEHKKKQPQSPTQGITLSAMQLRYAATFFVGSATGTKMAGGATPVASDQRQSGKHATVATHEEADTVAVARARGETRSRESTTTGSKPVGLSQHNIATVVGRNSDATHNGDTARNTNSLAQSTVLVADSATSHDDREEKKGTGSTTRAVLDAGANTWSSVSQLGANAFQDAKQQVAMQSSAKERSSALRRQPNVSGGETENASASDDTSLNYRFATWQGQPNVNVRVQAQQQAFVLTATSEHQHVQQAMQQHADTLSADMKLQFDRESGDGRDERSAGDQQRSEAEEQ